MLYLLPFVLVALLERTEARLGDDLVTEERRVIPVAHSPTLARIWDNLSVAIPMKLSRYIVLVVTLKLR